MERAYSYNHEDATETVHDFVIVTSIDNNNCSLLHVSADNMLCPQKVDGDNLCQNLTDFQNYFTVGKKCKL